MAKAKKLFKPLLAGKVEADKLTFPKLASAKIDGVRCIIIDGVAQSRNIKPIPNKYIQKILGNKAYNGLDGELIVGYVGGKDVYRNTVSAVMREDGEPFFTFWIFDKVDENLPYTKRYASIKSFDGHNHITVLPQTIVNNMEELDAYEARQLDRGLEGVILRGPDTLYKYGRSSTKEAILLKLKRFEDSEAVIIGMEEKMHNNNVATTNALGRTERSSHKENLAPAGVMGALVVRDIKTDVEFNIGTGFDDEDRKNFWDKKEFHITERTIVKYKFFPSGSKDKPRFPAYHGLRDKIDL